MTVPAGITAVIPAVKENPPMSIADADVLASSRKSSVSRSDTAW